MERVAAESLLGKGYAAQLEAPGRDRRRGDQEGERAQQARRRLKTLQEELEKQGPVPSPEASDKKQAEIVSKTRERQAFLEDGQAELKRMRERAQKQAQALNGEFQQKIRPHIDAVAKDKGLDLLLDCRSAYTINSDFDISRDVIAKADEAEKAPRPRRRAAAAAPAGSQAAPAPPPSPSRRR